LAMRVIPVDKARYDKEYDALHVRFDLGIEDCTQVVDGIIIRYDILDEQRRRILGFTIHNFSKRTDEELKTYFPLYDFSEVRKHFFGEESGGAQ